MCILYLCSSSSREARLIFFIFVCALKLVLWHRIMVLLVVVMPREYMYNDDGDDRRMFSLHRPQIRIESGVKKNRSEDFFSKMLMLVVALITLLSHVDWSNLISKTLAHSRLY